MTVTIDMMEYATDGDIQTAYVTDSADSVDQQQVNFVESTVLGNDDPSWAAQTFQLSGALTVTAVELRCAAIHNSPTGVWTIRIETTSGSPAKPTGILADANASVTLSPTANTTHKVAFATSFGLSASTTYAIVVRVDVQSVGQNWYIGSANVVDPYPYGAAYKSTDSGSIWYTEGGTDDLYFKVYVSIPALQDYSESTIKTQGSYSLKGIAAITESLNKTLTHIVSPPVDLSGKNWIKFDLRSSRTGGNIKIGIHNSNGVTTEKTYSIVGANTFETCNWDISGVPDIDKNAIDGVKITITNADA